MLGTSTSTSALRVALADALQRVTAWRLGLGGMQAELGRDARVGASELRTRRDDCLRRLRLLRNELDALIATLDGDDRPTPVHPYAPICDACETCTHLKCR